MQRDQLQCEILRLARSSSLTLCVAESCTSGLISAALTDLAGSSAIFDRGFITYSNEAKRELLGVSQSTLDQYGAVSEAIAQEMARGALHRSHADIALSVTGIAGPGGTEHKPEGRVCFSLAWGEDVVSRTQEFGALGRDKVRTKATDYALFMILEHLKSRAAEPAS